MKISKLFHWLYFTVMMLPVFLIPIFAIYTRNENYSSNIELQVPENRIVDFNQLVPVSEKLHTFVLEEDYTSPSWIPNTMITFFTDATPYLNHYFICLQNCSNSNVMYFGSANTNYVANIKFQLTSYYIYSNRFSVSARVNAPLSSGTYSIDDFQLFDLTQMFGVGNEPTYEQFVQWYSADYYSYTLSEKQLLKDYSIITYNDTDVGSQLVYTLYNTVDKYFNFDNVFNFGSLYDWLQLNFFSGNAPLGFFIFWHYLIYWLLVSLLWLLFDVLMYVPLMIHRWLDKASLS